MIYNGTGRISDFALHSVAVPIYCNKSKWNKKKTIWKVVYIVEHACLPVKKCSCAVFQIQIAKKDDLMQFSSFFGAFWVASYFNCQLKTCQLKKKK